MQLDHLSKAAILTLCLVIISVVAWEYYWRSKGYTISYNDDKVIWTDKRKAIYQPADKATIFIGGSRIKFDLDIMTWEKLTGEKAVQLALVGTAPRLVLKDLARDEKFNGKVVMDVTEHAFFSQDTLRTERSAREGIKYFHEETPTQKVSAKIDYLLESKFVFLEEGKFSMNALLDELAISNRKGVLVRPRVPKYLSGSTFDRQSVFTSIFLNDTTLQHRQTAFWARNAVINKATPVTGEKLEAIFSDLKIAIDKIRSRGGMVVFVRPPSSGIFLERENRDYPLKKYWDQLLASTQTPGYYFSDYPETAHFICPETSHLSPTDAITYTESLAKILKDKSAWIFHPAAPLN